MAFFGPCRVKSRLLQRKSQFRTSLCSSEHSMHFLSIERTQPQTAHRASSFRFKLLFIPLLHVTGPIVVTSPTFTSKCDASAISCSVTRFSTRQAVYSCLLVPPDYLPLLLFVRAFALAFLALSFASSFLVFARPTAFHQVSRFPTVVTDSRFAASTLAHSLRYCITVHQLNSRDQSLLFQSVSSCGRHSCASDADIGLEDVPFFQPLGVHHDVTQARRLVCSRPFRHSLLTQRHPRSGKSARLAGTLSEEITCGVELRQFEQDSR